MLPELHQHDALVIVDLQNDFCPGGALPVAHGDRIVPELNRWAAAVDAAGGRVYATRDWHPAQHSSFADRGGPWPPHCVQGTEGAALHPGLSLPPDAEVVDKGCDPEADNYSAFDGTDLAERMRAAGIRRLWVGGLALDYCVLATVLDGLKEGFEVHVLMKATRPVEVHPGDGQRAVEKMNADGAIVETADRES